MFWTNCSNEIDNLKSLWSQAGVTLAQQIDYIWPKILNGDLKQRYNAKKHNFIIE